MGTINLKGIIDNINRIAELNVKIYNNEQTIIGLVRGKKDETTKNNN